MTKWGLFTKTSGKAEKLEELDRFYRSSHLRISTSAKAFQTSKLTAKITIFFGTIELASLVHHLVIKSAKD